MQSNPLVGNETSTEVRGSVIYNVTNVKNQTLEVTQDVALSQVSTEVTVADGLLCLL